MTSTFIIVSILEVAAVALIITGFVFEKKLINFEEKFETALAKKIAHFLCTNKYTKTHLSKRRRPLSAAVQPRLRSSPRPSLRLPAERATELPDLFRKSYKFDRPAISARRSFSL